MITPQKFRDVFIEIVRILLIILFVYAAVTKLMVYKRFIVQIGLSPLLPSFLTSSAWVVPVVELAIAALLIFSRTLRVALYGSALLMLAFTLYITGILTIARHVPCSCGGVLENMSWGQHLIFNIAYLLLAIAAVICIEAKQRLSLNSYGQ